ncbi:MAG: MauE/DoxX family redox-associated membrane protein [Candidatus Acidiferrales bacterium]
MNAESRAKLGRILLLLGRLGMGGIFLYAAYSKLWPLSAVKTNLAFFAMQVDSYQLLPGWAVMFVAKTLPWFELVLGLGLVAGWPLRLSSSAASALILGFFIVIVRSYAMGLQINCGCFGQSEKLDYWAILRDGSMLALSLAVTIGAFVRHRKSSSHEISAVPLASPHPHLKTE